MRICSSRSLALTSSKRCTGFPESRVSTKTMLITTSMLSTVCSTRPIRKRHMLSGGPAHVLPVVKAHVTGDHRPIPDLRPDARDRGRRTDRDARHVLGEPRPHLVPHDAHALLIARLHGEPIDVLVELRMLDEQAQGRLGVAGSVENL